MVVFGYQVLINYLIGIVGVHMVLFVLGAGATLHIYISLYLSFVVTWQVLIFICPNYSNLTRGQNRITT